MAVMLAQAGAAWHITNFARPAALNHMATTVTPASDPTVDPGLFWFRYKNAVIAGTVIVLVALLGAGGYWLYNSRRNAAAAQLCASAKTAAEYRKVIEQYPGTPASGSAYLLLAEQQRNEQKFADANATLQTFIAKFPKHELISTAWMAIGANLESLGKTDEALASYQRLTTSDPHSFNAPLAMLAQVRLLKEKKQIEEARRVCENILTQYHDSFVAGEATRQLRLLKPPEPTPAPSAAQAPVPGNPPPAPLANPAAAAPAAPPTAPPPASSPSPSLPKP